MQKNEGTKDDLDTIKGTLRQQSHLTKIEKLIIMCVPENVGLREEAAARCTAKIKRRMLKKQAWKARAEHQVKYCLEPRKKKAKRKPLSELYVKGHFTEDREEWQKEL